MFTMRITIVTILAAFLLLNGVFGSFLNVMNKCTFPVYCSAARSDPPSGTFTPIHTVAAGATWQSPLEARKQTNQDFGYDSFVLDQEANFRLQDNIGAVMKCSPDSNVPDTNQYQMELTVHGDSGQSWVDLSIVNGQPFANYQRAAYFPSMGPKCSRLQCAPGDHSCEWCPVLGQTTCTPPRYIVCDTTAADAWMYLCAYGARKDVVEDIQQECS